MLAIAIRIGIVISLEFVFFGGLGSSLLRVQGQSAGSVCCLENWPGASEQG